MADAILLRTTMRPRLRHLPEKADQCLGCACANGENLAAQELLLITGSSTVRGVLAAIFITGFPEYAEVVSLAREAIREQREWCDENGAFDPVACRRHHPVLPMPGGEAPVVAGEQSE